MQRVLTNESIISVLIGDRMYVKNKNFLNLSGLSQYLLTLTLLYQAPCILFLTLEFWDVTMSENVSRFKYLDFFGCKLDKDAFDKEFEIYGY